MKVRFAAKRCRCVFHIVFKTGLSPERLVLVPNFIVYIPEMLQNRPITFSCSQSVVILLEWLLLLNL